MTASRSGRPPERCGPVCPPTERSSFYDRTGETKEEGIDIGAERIVPADTAVRESPE